MKKLIVLVVLSAASGFVSADGFQPWENRDVVNSDLRSASDQSTFTGFAPWRDREVQVEPADAGLGIATADPIGFRPWS